jgi:hypothetical protein
MAADERTTTDTQVPSPGRRRPVVPLWLRLVVAALLAAAVALGASYALRKMNL